MIIFIGMLISVISGVICTFLVKKEKTAGKIIHSLIRSIVMVNLISFMIMKYAFRIDDVYQLLPETAGHIPQFIISNIIAAIIWCGCSVLPVKTSCFVKPEEKRKRSVIVLRVIGAVLFTLGALALTATVWGKEFFGDLTPDQLIINLTSPTAGTDPGVYISGIENVVITTAFASALFFMFSFSDYEIVFKKKDKEDVISVLSLYSRRVVSFVMALSLMVGGCAYGIYQFSLVDLYRSYIVSSDFIKENFADPNTVGLEFPEKKRNLIHIYLESMENTYLSKELGGFCDDNLIPHLYELWHEGYSFSHLPEGLGGFQESTGAGWSVASMVNMGTGLPMKVPDKQNLYGVDGEFLPGATAIGDILKEQGYEQTVMFGANADFGGLTHYFRTHGDFTIIDHKEAKKRGYIPKDYYVFWGYEDDKLYEFAKDELTRLSETGKPFHFMMETADTHTPEGYLPAGAPAPYDAPYANAIRYSQEETVKFVRWIQQQPFYENTTIIIIGDHLSMADTFFEGIKGMDNYHRSCYNLIINPAPGVADIDESRYFNRDWAVFDMFPTILASIGVEIEGDRLGIGTNLFSERDTVFEQYGVKFVNKELIKRSDYYIENILQDTLVSKEETSSD